jgi:hypothetical protein
MKKLILLFVMITTLWGITDDELYRELTHLSKKQQTVLVKTYKQGKLYNLHHSLSAIAWIESNFGVNKINNYSHDYGVFQINLRTFKNRHKKALSIYNVSDKKIKKILTNDYQMSFLNALMELRFWAGVYEHKANKYYRMWCSYNAGYDRSNGIQYADNIKQRIRVLKEFKHKSKLFKGIL